jgi:hypothetical protein
MEHHINHRYTNVNIYLRMEQIVYKFKTLFYRFFRVSLKELKGVALFLLLLYFKGDCILFYGIKSFYFVLAFWCEFCFRENSISLYLWYRPQNLYLLTPRDLITCGHQTKMLVLTFCHICFSSCTP